MSHDAGFYPAASFDPASVVSGDIARGRPQHCHISELLSDPGRDVWWPIPE
jgi:hypothetical protein